MLTCFFGLWYQNTGETLEKSGIEQQTVSKLHHRLELEGEGHLQAYELCGRRQQTFSSISCSVNWEEGVDA